MVLRERAARGKEVDMTRSRQLPLGNRAPLMALSFLVFAGCVAEPPRPAPVVSLTPPDSSVFFYPAQGQPAPAPEQQERDRYECNDWAVRQTGFDPSLPNVPPHQRLRVVPGGAPPGAGVAVGAVTGAVVGGAVAEHSGRGALIGAVAGAAIGGIADADRAEATDHAARAAAADSSRAQAAVLEQRAQNYRRAMTACLEGRGYIVR